MNIEIDSKDLILLRKHFNNRADKMEKVIGTIIKKSALTVERFTKMYSPVRTGRLRASIMTTEIATLYATVQPTVYYAPYVNARVPFMFAGRQDSLPEIEQITKDEVQNAIK